MLSLKVVGKRGSPLREALVPANSYTPVKIDVNT
tara:strand:+ start:159 stop:260 length:102 start_codon:yes stop_codon:yes gene_type:complete